MVLNSEHIGNYVLVKHKESTIIFIGVVVDGDFNHAIIKLEDVATEYIEDKFNEIDTRYDLDVWELVRMLQGLPGDSGRYHH